MTSDFKIIDFKNLGKRDINGFLTEKPIMFGMKVDTEIPLILSA